MPYFEGLPAHYWVTDYGFRKQLNALKEGRGTYYQQEKSRKKLLDLLKYQDDDAREATIAYFDLPADTIVFLSWVHKYAVWRDEYPDSSHDQDALFPYEALYQVYKHEGAGGRSSYVVAYKDRLEETDGTLLLQLPEAV
jgi:hypothetical protein